MAAVPQRFVHQNHTGENLSRMSFLSETHRQNKEQRTRRSGPGAEQLRERSVEALRAHMEAFYEHGSQSDITFLIESFEQVERDARARGRHGQAFLIDALLGFADAQRSPSQSSSGATGRTKNSQHQQRKPTKKARRG